MYNHPKMTMADILVSFFVIVIKPYSEGCKTVSLKVIAQKSTMKENCDSKVHLSVLISFCWSTSHSCYNGTQVHELIPEGRLVHSITLYTHEDTTALVE